MRKEPVIAGGLFALGLALLGGSAVMQGAGPSHAQATDGPGPNLVIEVAGEANGTIVIDMLPDLAPKHVEQITTLAREGAYDGVVFHRVIEGFMAQTGDVQFGKGDDTSRAGMGGSEKPNLPAEFSSVSFDRGIVGMARSQSPDSANSQFFIMFAPGPFLDGQYTVVGRVIDGLDVLDAIKRGRGGNGEVTGPDRMVRVTVTD
ncbi:MAG: peptidylprolyl isomerase [Pseudorhodobacter sp.]